MVQRKRQRGRAARGSRKSEIDSGGGGGGSANQQNAITCLHCGSLADRAGITTDDLQVKASDEKGHSERLYTRVPPQLAHEITNVVADPNTPWKSPSDYLRWSAFFGLRWTHKFLPTSHKSFMAVLDSISRALQRQEMLVAFEESIRAVEVQVNRLQSVGASVEAVRLIYELYRNIEQLPTHGSSGFWRQKYMRELKTKFGPFLKQNRNKASLVPTVEEWHEQATVETWDDLMGESERAGKEWDDERAN